MIPFVTVTVPVFASSILTRLLLLSLPTQAGKYDEPLKICGDGQTAGNASEYAPSSSFHANLNSLLSSLSLTPDTRNQSGFNHLSVGEGTSDAVYGLSLCRGDVEADICHHCVAAGGVEIVQKCVGFKKAAIWFDFCMLRYSSGSFFSAMAEKPVVNASNGSVADPGPFQSTLGNLMDDLVTRAVNDRSPPVNFATGEANLSSSSHKLYVLLQCTPDLAPTYCNICLRIAISELPVCCNNKQEARVATPSCYIRYEGDKFYNQTSDAAPPHSTVGNRRNTIKIVIIALSVLAALILVIVVLYIIRRRFHRKKSEGHQEKTEEILLRDLGESNCKNIPREYQHSDKEMQYFDLAILNEATNNFSEDNRLGQGGFGPVYRVKREKNILRNILIIAKAHF